MVHVTLYCQFKNKQQTQNVLKIWFFNYCGRNGKLKWPNRARTVCVLQCVGKAVGRYSWHNPHHSDHIWIYRQRIHSCWFINGGLASATFMSSAIFLFENTGCRSLFILYTTRFLHTILVFKDRPRIWLLVFMNLKVMNESSKRRSKLLSLIFTLNCLSKTSVINKKNLGKGKDGIEATMDPQSF